MSSPEAAQNNGFKPFYVLSREFGANDIIDYIQHKSMIQQIWDILKDTYLENQKFNCERH